MTHPAGETNDGSLRVDFDRRLLLQFRGSVVTSDAGLLAYRERDDALSNACLQEPYFVGSQVEARIARWDRPIASARERFEAWLHLVAADHGVFRLVYLNEHPVSDKLRRCAQPAPHDFARFKAAGVRTIVNLRGGREHGAWQLQRESCDRLGLDLVDFIVRSRLAPARETVLAAPAFFERIAYPAVIHCKSGADRVGFVAALYLIVHEGRSVEEAMRQLSLRFGHFRFAKTGILDYFFERYLAEGQKRGLSFLDWAENVYDPQALERDFRPSFFSDLLVERIIRRE